MLSFPLITVRGSPLECGRSYGEAARDIIEHAIAIYRRQFEQRGVAWKVACDIGAEFAERVRNYSRPMHAELTGIAEGADRPIGEIVALNARTELLFSATGRLDPAELGGEGCTGAIVLGSATATGDVLHTQNWDWRKESADITVILQIEPTDGPAILTLVEAGSLARSGVNSAGIAITGNFLKSEDAFASNGVPAPFVRRQVLMSSNLHDAMLAAACAPRSFSINVMISDAGGEAIDFEATPEQVFWLRPENGILVHANHFVSPAALSKVNDLGLQVTPDSLYRERRVREYLDRQHPRITRETLEEIFADRYGSPYGICREDDGTEASVVTLATVLMNVTDRTMSIAREPYKGRAFQTYALPKRT